MKIKRISDYTLEECHKYLNENPDGMERMAIENQMKSILGKMDNNQKRDEILKRIEQEEREKDVDWIDFKRVIDEKSFKDLTALKRILYALSIVVIIFFGIGISAASLEGNEYYSCPSDFVYFCDELDFIRIMRYESPDKWCIRADEEGYYALGCGLISVLLLIGIFYIFHSPSLKLIYNIEEEEKVKSYRRTMDKKGNIGLHKCCRFRIIQILPFQFNNIYYCGGSAYVCMKEGKRGVYNVVKKKMVIEVDYDSIEVLSDGTLKALKNGIYSRFTTEGYRIIE